MASGRPVIAYGVGGVTETVIPGETGIFFHEQTWESLLDAVIHFHPSEWDSAHIRKQAGRFDAANFKRRIRQYVEDRYEESQRGLLQCALDVWQYADRH